MLKDASPFTPGKPVGVDLFAGRERQLEYASTILNQTVRGRQDNIFLIGDKGIGKSSFSSMTRELALRKYGMVGAHVSLGGVDTVEELTRRVVERVMQAGLGQPWYRRIFQALGDHVKEVGILSLKVSFQAPASDIAALARNFPDVLDDFATGIIEDGGKGLVIVLDDINGLAETPTFARWYKSVVDSIAIRFGKNYPVLIMLSGIQPRRLELAQHEPSLLRIFTPIELDRLSDEEVSYFFQDAFDQVQMRVQDQALRLMTNFSSGLPLIMQQIGEDVFMAASDRNVTLSDARYGVLTAKSNVGQKYLAPSVSIEFQNRRYRSIFHKIGQSIKPTFSAEEISAQLDDDEKPALDNLLIRLRDLEVIESDPLEGRGAYRYTNQIYPAYLYMQSQL